MIIKSPYPVYINGSLAQGEDWLSLDASSSRSEIKAFQDWMDTTHPNWVLDKNNLNKGSGYGTFGRSTGKAWKNYGSEYTASQGSATTPSATPPATTTSSPTDTPVKPNATTPEDKASTDKQTTTGQPIKGKAKDKKPMSMTTKILIGAGGVVLLIGIIWGITKATK